MILPCFYLALMSQLSNTYERSIRPTPPTVPSAPGHASLDREVLYSRFVLIRHQVLDVYTSSPSPHYCVKSRSTQCASPLFSHLQSFLQFLRPRSATRLGESIPLSSHRPYNDRIFSGCATHVSAEEIATLEAQFALDFAASGRADSVSTLRASIPVGTSPFIFIHL